MPIPTHFRFFFFFFSSGNPRECSVSAHAKFCTGPSFIPPSNPKKDMTVERKEKQTGNRRRIINIFNCEVDRVTFKTTWFALGVWSGCFRWCQRGVMDRLLVPLSSSLQFAVSSCLAIATSRASERETRCISDSSVNTSTGSPRAALRMWRCPLRARHGGDLG